MAVLTSSVEWACSSTTVEQASPTATTATATETATASPQSSGNAAVGPGDFYLPDPRAGLDALSSFEATLTRSFEGTRNGASSPWTSTWTLSHTAAPRATQLTVETTGAAPDAYPSYLAEKDGTAYELDSSGACTARLAGSAASLAALIEPASLLAGVMGATELGHESVNGVEADGYSFDERALGQAGLTTSTGEVWVATQGGYVVRYKVSDKGESAFLGEGTAGTISLLYDLTHVNVPFAIELPAGCPAGLVGAPLLPDAANVVNAPGMLSYDTASTVKAVVAFYQQKSAELGWASAGAPLITATGGFADYTLGGDKVSLVASKGASCTSVTIVRARP